MKAAGATKRQRNSRSLPSSGAHPHALAGRRVHRLRELLGRHTGNGARAESVYNALRAAILENVLREEERLTERELASALGMSRTPVREALQRLQVEGLAREAPGTGLVVFKSTPREVEEIYSVRVRLEGMAAELAARLATPGDVAFLGQLQAKIERASRRRRFDQATSLNRQFHDAVCRIGRNEKLAGLVNLLHDIVQKADSTTLRHPGRAAQANREHRMILEAIRRGGAEAARRLAEQHMEHAKQVRLVMVSERRQ